MIPELLTALDHAGITYEERRPVTADGSTIVKLKDQDGFFDVYPDSLVLCITDQGRAGFYEFEPSAIHVAIEVLQEK